MVLILSLSKTSQMNRPQGTRVRSRQPQTSIAPGRGDLSYWKLSFFSCGEHSRLLSTEQAADMVLTLSALLLHEVAS